MSFFTADEILSMKFAFVGDNVLISKKASFYGIEKISIGSNVRIDDFCILSAGAGGIVIGNYVHIAAYSSLIGSSKIILSDFSGLSSRVSVYSSNDDYSGLSLTNPTVPDNFKMVTNLDVYLGKHVIVGSGSILLPGAFLEDGVAIGAMSLVKGRCKSFGIYSGNPLKFIKERKRDLLKLEEKLLIKE